MLKWAGYIAPSIFSALCAWLATPYSGVTLSYYFCDCCRPQSVELLALMRVSQSLFFPQVGLVHDLKASVSTRHDPLDVLRVWTSPDTTVSGDAFQSEELCYNLIMSTMCCATRTMSVERCPDKEVRRLSLLVASLQAEEGERPTLSKHNKSQLMLDAIRVVSSFFCARDYPPPGG